MENLRVGVITINDGCSLNDEVDILGAELVRIIKNGALRRSEVVKACILPKDINAIERKVTEWCSSSNLHLIFTLGGLEGNCVKRAISSLLERELPGMLKLLRTAPLNEQDNVVCGIRGQTVIVTLPEDDATMNNCLRLIKNSVEHAIFILTGFGQPNPRET